MSREGRGGSDGGVEDETDLIGAADVEVVADDLLEEDPTRDRCVEHLGQGELGLQDRHVVAVAGGPIGAVNGCGESGQPLALQRIDIRWPQPVGVLVIALIGGVRIHRIRPTFDKRRR